MDRHELESLLIWHDRDLRLDGLERQLARLPAEIARCESLIRDEQHRVDTAQQGLKALEVKRANTEGQIASHEAAIVRYKTQQLQVKKNEEYAALNHQIANEQQAISDLEDQVLALLDEVESAKAAMAVLKEEANGVIAYQRQQIAAFREQEAATQGEIDDARTNAQAAESEVSEESRRQYAFVKKQVKRPPYLVGLHDNRCPACHIRISGEVEAQARKAIGYARCDNCGRMVYWAG